MTQGISLEQLNSGTRAEFVATPEEAGEWLLIVKTTTAAFPQVRAAIAELHSYAYYVCSGGMF